MKIIMIVLLLLISQHASGVEVYEGAESVLLPCQVSVGVSRNSTSAVWDRDGLSDKKVHLRRQKSDDPDEQHVLYQHRTSMRVDALQTGVLSLTLRNPTVSDSGTYTCTTVRYGDRLSQSEVQLKVSEPPPVWPKVLSAVLVTLIILAAAFGLFVCCACKRMKNREALKPEVVEVPQGEKSVVLPFKTTADLPQDITVKWTDFNNMKVHVYESGNNRPDKQNQDYRGHTEMNEDPLRTKDFSLTLKHLRPTDSGIYTCTICNKGGEELLQKSVTLSVRVPPPEVVNATDADESVLLPFTTTAVLPQNVTVEWTVTEPEERKVHVYKSENNQSHNQDQDYRGRTEMKKDPLTTKDLSLTLKDLHLTDSGVYTCTIYNKDGHMLLQKVVTLSVRESVPDIVQVQKFAVSALLPFKTTADLAQDVTVEWSDSNNMKVHVYESGNNQSHNQDQDNKSRTEMDEDPLRTGDLSLTLKDLHLTDSGVYTCTVYNKDEYTLLQKSVTLIVYDTVSMIGTVYGNKSYLLEFQKTNKLDQISKVKWERIYPKYKFIKEITRYQGNEEDLSLNLEDLHLSDSGIYTCTAYKENGDILLRHSVTFSVRDFQLEMVEVTEGEESVLLPFKTTADLHHVLKVYWAVSEPKKMMVDYFDVYENKQPHKQQNINVQPGSRIQNDYIGRTEMNEDLLRTGDFSLTLKKPLPTDSGSYTCTVLNKDGRILQQKVVTLRVRATLKGTIEDMLLWKRRRTAPKPAPNAEVKEDVRNTNQEAVSLMEVHSA